MTELESDDKKNQYALVRHKRQTPGENGFDHSINVEIVKKDKFDFTDYRYLKINEPTGIDEYVHKDEYELYHRLANKTERSK